ncbi:MAG: phosphatase PAP2 family protein [Chloroflexaceae bacterium]|nr:phosphatase PAP2 family protein [Chloroflexaceae bacterium]
MVMQIVPAILFFVIRLRQGAYSDEDVSVRHERNELYLVSLVTITLGTLMLLFLNAPIALIALHVGVWVISLLCWIINVFWKISVHATTASSTATIAFFLSPVLGLILGIGAVLVGWSRVRTGNHTPLQVLAGLVLAIVGISATFAVFGLI